MNKEREKTEINIYAEGLSHLVQRWDLFPQQLNDGRYVTIRAPLTVHHIIDHLKGNITLGLYLLDARGYSRYSVLDVDDEENFNKLTSALGSVNFPTYLERSRRGGHLWMFFENEVEGGRAKRFGETVRDRFNIQAEVFPKQAKSEVGSLVRMPFGIHRKTGERYMFIKPDLFPLGTWREQLREISNPQKIPLNYLPPAPEPRVFKPNESSNLIEFIGQFVELKRTPSGAIGHCPLHEDKHASFSINEKGNYWHCFAGCGGGSLINFWMKFKNLPYREALEDLKRYGG